MPPQLSFSADAGRRRRRRSYSPVEALRFFEKESNNNEVFLAQGADARERVLIRTTLAEGLNPGDVVITIVNSKLVVFVRDGAARRRSFLREYDIPENTELLDGVATLSESDELTLALPISPFKSLELFINEQTEVGLDRLLNNRPGSTKTLARSGKTNSILNTIKAFSQLRVSTLDGPAATERVGR